MMYWSRVKVSLSNFAICSSSRFPFIIKPVGHGQLKLVADDQGSPDHSEAPVMIP